MDEKIVFTLRQNLKTKLELYKKYNKCNAKHSYRYAQSRKIYSYTYICSAIGYLPIGYNTYNNTLSMHSVYHLHCVPFIAL